MLCKIFSLSFTPAVNRLPSAASESFYRHVAARDDFPPVAYHSVWTNTMPNQKTTEGAPGGELAATQRADTLITLPVGFKLSWRHFCDKSIKFLIF